MRSLLLLGNLGWDPSEGRALFLWRDTWMEFSVWEVEEQNKIREGGGWRIGVSHDTIRKMHESLVFGIWRLVFAGRWSWNIWVVHYGGTIPASFLSFHFRKERGNELYDCLLDTCVTGLWVG